SATELGGAREGAGFELVMGARKVEQLYDARGIRRLSAAITGACGMVAIGKIDDGDGDFSGCQAACTEALDGGRGGIMHEFVECIGSAKHGFLGGALEHGEGEEQRQIETAHRIRLLIPG